MLQPRVQVSVESASRTPFAQVFSGHVGLDPYTTAVSDVYQDLFHEGSYVGKGIYDVDAFEAALAGRVPENTLLSHDLFEGLYARAGLCTDIDLVDDYPVELPGVRRAAAPLGARRLADRALALAHACPTRAAALVPNTLPAIARWKILDNLRRSLLRAGAGRPASSPGWTVLPGSALVWSALAAAGPRVSRLHAGRALADRAASAACRCASTSSRSATTWPTSARQAFLSTVFLLHQSWVMLDAIGRTLVRLLVTRRRLLEWVTADRVRRTSRRTLDAACCGRCCATPIAAGAIARAGRRRRARAAAARASDPRALVPVAGARLRDRAAARARPRGRSQRAERAASARSRGGRGASSTTSSARRSLADPRQPSGGPPRARRAPHLADQHRPAAALDARRLRLRLPQRRRPARPARADVCHAAAHAALPRPLLQLVRHAHARAAARRPTSRRSTAATWPAIS